MKSGFAWSVPQTEVRALATLRDWHGVETLTAPFKSEAAGSASIDVAPPRIWLRAATLDDEQWARCLHLPGVDRYTVLYADRFDEGRLVRYGSLVPHGRLPPGTWSPIRAQVNLRLPTAIPATRRSPTKTPIALVRSDELAEPNWLLTSLAEWTAYVVAAPQVRLARWTFIASTDGRVVVRGTPVPPLPGARFVERSGLVVPAGWTWSPAVEPEILRAALRLTDDDAAWWTVDGRQRIIPAGDWVQASRSAVRLTAREIRS